MCSLRSVPIKGYPQFEDAYHLAMCEAERARVASLVEVIRTSPDFTNTWKAFHTVSGEELTSLIKNVANSRKRE